MSKLYAFLLSPAVRNNIGFKNSGNYLILFLIAVACAIVCTLIYYFILDSPKLNKVKFWLLIGTGNLLAGIIPIQILIKAKKKYNFGIGFSESFSLLSMNVLYAFVLFLLLSVLVKNFSVNSILIPFTQPYLPKKNKS